MATITKRGPRRYQARIRRKGYPTITRTFDTRAEAERFVRGHEFHMDNDSLPATLAAQQTSLSVALEDYRNKVTHKHRGAEPEKLRLQAMEAQPFAALPLAKLNAIVIEDYIDDRLKKVSGSTVNRELSILVQVFKRARKQGWMVHDPMDDVVRPTSAPHRERRLNKAERKRFKKALAKSRNKLFRLFVFVSQETGMRRGELLGLEWSQTDLPARVIRLRAEQTKMATAREVPLTRKAEATLLRLRSETGGTPFVFAGLTADAVKKCWVRLCVRANITDFRLHDLRHERVSSLVDAGWSVLQAMAVSGHKDVRAFNHYSHPDTEILLENLDRLPVK